MQEGKFRVNTEPVPIRQLVEEVYNLIQVQMHLKKQVHFFVTVDPDVPEIAQTDYQRLKQVLINLLRNSTKFTFKGYIMLRVYPTRLSTEARNQPLFV